MEWIDIKNKMPEDTFERYFIKFAYILKEQKSVGYFRVIDMELYIDFGQQAPLQKVSELEYCYWLKED